MLKYNSGFYHLVVLAFTYLIACQHLISSAEAHGYMTDPPARSGKNDFLINKQPCGGDQFNNPGAVSKTYEGNPFFEPHHL